MPAGQPHSDENNSSLSAAFFQANSAFAHLNLADSIQQTELSTLSIEQAFNYFIYELGLGSASHAKSSIDINISQTQQRAVADALTDLLIFEKLLQALDEMRGNDLDVTLLIDKINERPPVTYRNHCYFPAGWLINADNEVIFAGLKITISKNGYECEFVNSVAGSEFHRPLIRKNNHLGKDYRSETYLFSRDALHEFNLFLHKIVLLRIDARPYAAEYAGMKINVYSQVDLYNAIRLHGQCIEKEYDETTRELYAVIPTPERSGIMKNLKHVLRDAIISSGEAVTTKTIRRFMFALKLRSIDAAFARYQRLSSTAEKFALRALITAALHQYSVRVLKLAPEFLSLQEMDHCKTLVEPIREKLALDKAIYIESQIAPVSLPTSEIINEGASPIKVPEVPPAQPFHSTMHEPIVPFMKPEWLRFTPEKILKQLEKINAYFREGDIFGTDFFGQFPSKPKSDLAARGYLKKLRNVMFALPTPSGEENDIFWDAVPSHHLETILGQLVDLVKLCDLGVDPRYFFFETSIIAYDIAAQIAPRIKHLKLTETTLLLDNVYTYQYVFSDPKRYFKVKKIEENFQRRVGRSNGLGILSNSSGAYRDKKFEYFMETYISPKQLQKIIKVLLKRWDLKKEAGYADRIKKGDKKLIFDILVTGYYENQRTDEHGHTHFDTDKISLWQYFDKSIYSIFCLSACTHKALRYWLHGEYHSDYSIEDLSRYLNRGYSNRDGDSYRFSSTPFNSLKNYYNCKASYFPVPYKLTQEETLYRDFAENVLYHPSGHKQNLIQLTTNAQYPNAESEFVLPVLNEFGTFRDDCNAFPELRKQGEQAQKDFFKELNEDFCSIETSVTLRVQRLLIWGCSNFTKFKFPDIRKRFSELLFEYGKLDLALREAGQDVMPLIAKFLKTCFRFYRVQITDDTKDVLPWICFLQKYLYAYIETCSAEYALDTSAIILPDLHIIITDMLKEAVSRSRDEKQMLAICYLLTLPNEPELAEFSWLVASALLSNPSGIGDTFYRDAIRETWETHKPTVIQHISSLNVEDRNNFFNHVMSIINGYPVTNTWIIKYAAVLALETDYLINLNKIELKSGHEKLANEDKLVQKHELLRHLIKYTPPTQFVCAKRHLIFVHKTIISVNSAWEIKISDLSFPDIKVLSVLCTFDINDTKARFKLNLEHESLTFLNRVGIKMLPFLETEAENYYFWYGEEGTILALSKNSHDDGFLYREGEGWHEITAQNHQWQVNPNIVASIPEWCEFFSSITPAKNVLAQLIFVNQNTYRVQKLLLRDLGLTFTNVDGRFESDQVAGFYLSQQPVLAELCHIKSIIILENKEGLQRYVVPINNFKAHKNAGIYLTGDIVDNQLISSQDIQLDGQGWNFTYATEKPYFVYQPDTDGMRVSESREGESRDGYFYLALLFRYQGNYQLAIRYLQLSQHHYNASKRMLELANLILLRRDTTRRGVAFDCKLHIFLMEHTNKWVESKFAETRLLAELTKVFGESISLYKHYRSCFKEGVSVFPEYLALTPEEIKSLSPNDDPAPSFAAKKEDDIINFTEAFDPIDIQEWYKQLQLFMHDQPIDLYGDQRSFIKEVVEPWIAVTLEPVFLRIYPLEKKLHANRNIHLGLNYVIQNFHHLYQLARSTHANDQRQLQLCLSSVINSCSHIASDSHSKRREYHLLHALIVLLLLTSSNRDQLAEIKNQAHKSLDLINQLLDQFKPYIARWGDNKLADESDILKPIEVNFLLGKQFTASVISQAPLQQSLKLNNSQTFQINGAQKTEKTKPLQKLFADYFTAEMRSVAEGEFPLNVNARNGRTTSRLEKDFIKTLRHGHVINQQKQKLVYHFDTEKTLVALNADLDSEAKRCVSVLQVLSNHLEGAVNETLIPDDKKTDEFSALQQHLLFAARASANKRPLTIDDLILALADQDCTHLNVQNPFLLSDATHEILINTVDFALLTSKLNQIREIQKLIAAKTTIADLSPYELQLLGRTLGRERYYNVAEYPLFLVYEYATRRMLREDQVKLLIIIINCIKTGNIDSEEFQHALIQFAAGGGKTSVLIMILAYYFAQQGLLPVIFNTDELYNIGISDIPENLRMSLKQRMEVLERNLEHSWFLNEFDRLLKDLERWRSDRKCLLISPVTWYSIYLCMREAYINNNISLGQSALQVLDFFKYRSIKLEDENHLISDPLQITIKTYGPMQHVPMDQKKLLLRFYDYLLGYENCDEIVRLAGITEQSKKMVGESSLQKIQLFLAEKISKDSSIVGNVIVSDLIYEYLVQASNEKPQWLETLYQENPNLANVIVLARAFLYEHLRHILSLQLYKNYGPSIHAGDLTVAPMHDGQAVKNHLGDQPLVVAGSIQYYSQCGALQSFIEKIFAALLVAHLNERLRPRTKTVTDAEQEFNSLLPDDYVYQHLDGMTNMQLLTLINDERVQKSPLLIKYFLINYVFEQIKTPRYRAIATPAELQFWFQNSLMLSATPGLVEALPVFIKPENCFLQPEFVANVLDVLIKQARAHKHAAYLLDMTHSPQAFFKEFYEKYPEDSLAINALIDRGSLVADDRPSRVIAAYLDQFSNLRAGISALCFEGREMLIRSRSAAVKKMNIPGSRLEEALAKEGLTIEAFMLFMFLNLAKATGTDVKRPFNDIAGLTVGKEQTITETTQSALRERLVLEDNAQQVSLIIFNELYLEIAPDDAGFDLLNVYYWKIANEARHNAIKIITRAYQGIHQLLESVLWDKIYEGKIAHADYKGKIETIFDIEPYNIYVLNSRMEKPTKVLLAYCLDLCAHFGLAIKEIPDRVFNYLDRIIAETASLIEKMQQPHGAELNIEVTQEQKHEVEVQVETKQQVQQQQQVTENPIEREADIKYRAENFSKSDSFANVFDDKELHAPQAKYHYFRVPGLEHCNFPPLIICDENFSPLDIGKSQHELKAERERAEQREKQRRDREKARRQRKRENAKHLGKRTASEDEFANILKELEMLSDNDEPIATKKIENTIVEPAILKIEGPAVGASSDLQKRLAVIVALLTDNAAKENQEISTNVEMPPQKKPFAKESVEDDSSSDDENCENEAIPTVYKPAIHYRKPIHMLLIQCAPDGETRYLACTTATAEFYRSILSQPEFFNNKYAYALAGIDGSVVYSSEKMTRLQKNILTQSKDFLEMLDFCQFLNGIVDDRNAVKRLRENYQWNDETYNLIKRHISEAHVSKHATNIHTVDVNPEQNKFVNAVALRKDRLRVRAHQEFFPVMPLQSRTENKLKPSAAKPVVPPSSVLPRLVQTANGSSFFEDPKPYSEPPDSERARRIARICSLLSDEGNQPSSSLRSNT